MFQKKNFIIILIVAISLSFYAGLKCKNSLDQLDEIGKPTMIIVPLLNDSLHEAVYLISKHWGLTGDHSIVALTQTTPENEWYPDSTRDIIFKGGYVFYAHQADTIKIWTSLLPENSFHFNTKQKIKFIEIDNVTNMNYREQINRSIKLVE